MAISFVTNQSLSRTPFITAFPYTVSFWMKVPSGADIPIWYLGNYAKNSILGYICAYSGHYVAAGCVGSEGWKFAYSTAAPGWETWDHVLAVFLSTTSHTIYLNGGNAGSNTDLVTPDVPEIESTASWVTGGGYDSEIAEFGIWNVGDLTAGEIVALAKGFSPPCIRPSALQCWHPFGNFYGNNALDRWKNKYDWTVGNTPTWTAHPSPIFYPGRPRVFQAAAVAATNRRRRFLVLGA